MTDTPAEKMGPNRIDFGAFQLDLGSGELRRDGEIVDLTALPARLLRYLAANRGRNVPKRELALEIWGRRHVGEASIQQAIRSVRLAVDDDGRSQRVIRTASGVGYRFVAQVSGSDLAVPPSELVPFVGRRSLLDECEARIEGVANGRGSMLLFSGDAGIGKTRLLDETERLASRSGLLVVRGGDRAPEGASPFWPWIDLFTSLTGLRPTDAIRERAPHLLGSSIDDTHPVNAPERFRHFEVAAQCLRQAAAMAPLVVLLEDLHRAGLYSWELLERIAASALQVPLLVVGTLRPREVVTDAARAHVFQRMTALPRVEVREIALLSDVESAYLVEQASGRELPAEHIPAIARSTAGSPLTAIEFARSLGHAETPIPEPRWSDLLGRSITRMLDVRLAELAPEVRSLLETAAAIGSTFDGELLVRASPLDGSWRPLEVAIAKRLVSELLPESNVYRFSHALVRDALYAGLSADADRCRRVHLCIADAIEAIDATRDAELAHHLRAAGADAGALRIIAATERAATSAAGGGEIDAAFQAYEDAFSALGTLEAVPSEALCEMLVAAGDLGVRGVRPEAARTMLDRAIEMARELGRADLLARAALARAYRTEIVGTSDEALVALLEEAISGLDGASPHLVAQLRSRSAIEIRYAPDGQAAALRLIDQAIVEAEASGDAIATARVLEDASLVRWSVEDPVGWRDLNERIVHAATEAGHTELHFQGTKGLATAHLETCDRAGFDREVERCAATSAEYPSPFLLAVVSSLRACQAFLDGDFAGAELRVLEAASSGLDDLAQLATAQIFYHRLETGRVTELEAATRQFVVDSPGVATWQIALARLLIDGHRLDEARASLQHLSVSDIPKDRNWFTAMAMLAECCTLLGDPAMGGEVFDEIEPFAAVGAVLGNGTVFYGCGAHHLGCLALLMGRLDEAERHLEEAASLHESIASEPWQLITRLEQARLAFARGDASAAADVAAAVAERAGSLGLVRCQLRAEAMSRAVA